MKQFNPFLVLALAVAVLFAAPAFADTASYTTLTAAQEDQLNRIGASSAFNSDRRVNLGTLAKELIDPTFTLSPSADSATTNKELVLALTSPADTTGTNSHYAQDITLTIGNATGGTNAVRGINIANVTGDASVNVRGISIGTGTTLGTSDALNIGTGWDTGITTGSPIVNSLAPTADNAATNQASDINVTTPVDTTGTNTYHGLNVDLTIGNASGGTNVATAINISNVTGDAQVTENGIVIGTGFDTGLTVNSPVSITSTLTGDGGDAFAGFLQSQVASTTTSVTAAQANKTFVSNSADVMTLPEASTVLGARYTFVCGTADDFDINPADTTDVIGTVVSVTGTNTTTVLAPSAGDAVRCTDIGSSIVLEAVAADLWASVGAANGIWTDVN